MRKKRQDNKHLCHYLSNIHDTRNEKRKTRHTKSEPIVIEPKLAVDLVNLARISLKSHSKTEFGHRGSLGNLGRTPLVVGCLQSIIDEIFWVETSMEHWYLSTLTSQRYMPSACPRNTTRSPRDGHHQIQRDNCGHLGKVCNPHSRQVMRKI